MSWQSTTGTFNFEASADSAVTITWDTAELEQASKLADNLSACRVDRQLSPRSKLLRFSPDDAIGLIAGIRTSPVAKPFQFLPIRHLYSLIGFEEHYPFRWRLEHKLVQALLLNHFFPNAVPITCGLGSYLSQRPELRTLPSLQEALADRYVKRTLGSGADRDCELETQRAIKTILSEKCSAPVSLMEERWVVQEKVTIAQEYRVHTIEDSVIPDLTYLRHSTRPIRVEREGPNEFVYSILQRLPAAFISNSLCGWDVAKTERGPYVVIEVNFSGFHPFVEPGFQCSGFFVQPTWGPYLIARLLRFIEKKYSVGIEFERAGFAPVDVAQLYSWISRWVSLFRISSAISDLASEVDSVAGESNSIDTSQDYLAARRLFVEFLSRLGTTVASLD